MHLSVYATWLPQAIGSADVKQPSKTKTPQSLNLDRKVHILRDYPAGGQKFIKNPK